MGKDKWLEFKELKGKPKTRVIEVYSKCSECVLGIIKWYPAWRHYCFFPKTQCIEMDVYSDRCLLSLSELITKLNKEHKKKT